MYPLWSYWEVEEKIDMCLEMWNRKKEGNVVNPREGREKQKQISKTQYKIVEMSKSREFLSDYRRIAFNYLKTEVNKKHTFFKNPNKFAVYSGIPNNQPKGLK